MAVAIGKRAHAQEIAEWFYDEEYPGSLNTDIWKRLGSGCSRTAWLHVPTDVVYKVSDWDDPAPGFGNRNELRQAKRLWKESDGRGRIGRYIKAPITSGFNVKGAATSPKLILAMEHGRDTGDFPSQGGHRALYRLGFGDMHRGNYVVLKGGRIMPIDMASPRYSFANQRGWTWDGPDIRALGHGEAYDKEYERRYG